MKTERACAFKVVWVMDFCHFTEYEIKSGAEFYKEHFYANDVCLELFDSRTISLDTECEFVHFFQDEEMDIVVLISDFSKDEIQSELLRDLKGYLMIFGVTVVSQPATASGLNISDKLSTALWLKCNNLPYIPTYKVYQDTTIRSVLRKLDLPVIIKPNKMARGFGVVKANSESEFTSMVELLTSSTMDLIVQKYIAAEYDIRVYVFKNQLIAHQVRSLKAGSILANVSKGARSVDVTLDPEILEIALKLSERLSLQFLAIDFLVDTQGHHYISEIETVLAGFSGLIKSKQKEVAECLVIYLSEIRRKSDNSI
ncbi:ATP-grasp domain-containing protein [Saccharospirillum impatiens]|uniref:ATP-grasp domain-containing protein n=1 Tax=Saccharospirillum impatiens TaxID=169438 RepID=UPI00042A1379|nr:hypothetical protein [Saccharospirillum impatiens]